ncbi:hypothetical protein ADUPG1_010171, partial [Aduncisulcus paluster]
MAFLLAMQFLPLKDLYDIECPLGKDTKYGKSFVAYEKCTREKVVVKYRSRKLFQQIEKRKALITKLFSSNIGGVNNLLDIRKAGNSIIFVSNFCKGPSLLDYICSLPKMTERDISVIVSLILVSLFELHSSNRYHGNITPGNIMINREIGELVQEATKSGKESVLKPWLPRRREDVVLSDCFLTPLADSPLLPSSILLEAIVSNEDARKKLDGVVNDADELFHDHSANPHHISSLSHDSDILKQIKELKMRNQVFSNISSLSFVSPEHLCRVCQFYYLLKASEFSELSGIVTNALQSSSKNSSSTVLSHVSLPSCSLGLFAPSIGSQCPLPFFHHSPLIKSSSDIQFLSSLSDLTLDDVNELMLGVELHSRSTTTVGTHTISPGSDKPSSIAPSDGFKSHVTGDSS